MGNPSAVYIHIPFCTHICHYCDFNKVFLKGQPVEKYLSALEKEMEMTFREVPQADLKTIFIGGGTPTALSDSQLVTLMEAIHRHIHVNRQLEFSIEANPGDLTLEKLMILKEYGVNRLSIGVQTFNNQLLEVIGRSHRADDVYVTIENAKKCGFDNISLDLMYALPGQTLEDVQYSLKQLFQLDIQHCSAYSLIVEPKTVFYNLMNKGKLYLPSEDDEARMYEYIMDEMDRNGFHQYEISNYAKPGYESRHNLIYWNNEHYFGFGAGAHSYLNSTRRANIGPVNKYIQSVEEGKLPIRENVSVGKKEQMEEEMFLGLRKISGVPIALFENKFSINPLELFDSQLQKLLKNNLIQISDGYIKLTRTGKMLGNEVFQEFLL